MGNSFVLRHTLLIGMFLSSPTFGAASMPRVEEQIYCMRLSLRTTAVRGSSGVFPGYAGYIKECTVLGAKT
jgi:hypothetical protein